MPSFCFNFVMALRNHTQTLLPHGCEATASAKAMAGEPSVAPKLPSRRKPCTHVPCENGHRPARGQEPQTMPAAKTRSNAMDMVLRLRPTWNLLNLGTGTPAQLCMQGHRMEPAAALSTLALPSTRIDQNLRQSSHLREQKALDAWSS